MAPLDGIKHGLVRVGLLRVEVGELDAEALAGLHHADGHGLVGDPQEGDGGGEGADFFFFF